MRTKFLIVLVLLFFASFPVSVEASSFFSRALGRTRELIQDAFQLNFIARLPVIFHRNSFEEMMKYSHMSVDEMHVEYKGHVITRRDFQDDKALHIKKSAMLALHLKSLTGSSHIAYAITMLAGLVKEAIDGSFLNPSGTREKEDVIANHVGAMSVFGKDRFDKALYNNMHHLARPSVIEQIKPDEHSNTVKEQPADELYDPEGFEQNSISYSIEREELLRSYQKAINDGNQSLAIEIGAKIQALGH